MDSCVFCDCRKFMPIIEASLFPRSVQKFYKTLAEAHASPTVFLSVGLCTQCGLMQNTAYKKETEEYYDENYYYAPTNVSPQAQGFQKELARRIHSHIGLAGKTCLEIGCGNGFFLNALTEHGANGIGYEPTTGYEYALKYKHLKIIKGFFEARTFSPQTLKADLFVLRHVLEHLDDPVSFLKDLRERCCDSKGVQYLYVEVPNTKVTMEENIYFDFYYDHIFYYHRLTLSRILLKCGWFPVHDVIDPDSEFLGIIAQSQLSETAVSSQVFQDFIQADYAKLALRFKENYQEWKNKLTSILEKIRKEGKTFAVWGTGARGMALLSALDLKRYRPAAIMDSDKNKHGLFLAVSDSPLCDPQSLNGQFIDYLLVTSYTFFDEIYKAALPFRQKGGRVIKVYPEPQIVT